VLVVICFVVFKRAYTCFFKNEYTSLNHQGLKEFDLDDRWLSVGELNNYFVITKDSLFKWVNEKWMPSHRLGNLLKLKTNGINEESRRG